MLRPYNPLIINECLGMNMLRYVCKIVVFYFDTFSSLLNGRK